MTAKDHYDKHLGNFYSWMAGDFNTLQNQQQAFLREYLEDSLSKNKIAYDLGAGHGIQSVSLAKLGYVVKAIDFNKQLLSELDRNKDNLQIEVIESDILQFLITQTNKADVIVCMGDTLTHLQHIGDVQSLIRLSADRLNTGGKLILSFRDLSKELEGTQRFIPVKSTNSRILTCFLEYFTDHVMVHDILHEKENDVWIQKISAYPKLRLSEEVVMRILVQNNFKIINSFASNRMIHIIGQAF